MNPLFHQNSKGAQNVNFLRQNVSVKGDIITWPINLTSFFWTISSFNYFPHYRCTFQATGGGGEGGNISDSETGSSAFDFEEDTNTLVVIFRFERETLHCWTMVSEWYEASRTLKLAVVLTSVTFIIFITAFFSPYWLQSVPSEKLPNPKFTNLGKFAKEQFPLLYWSHQNPCRFVGSMFEWISWQGSSMGHQILWLQTHTTGRVWHHPGRNHAA